MFRFRPIILGLAALAGAAHVVAVRAGGGEAAPSAPVTRWLVAAPLALPPMIYGSPEASGAAKGALGTDLLDPSDLWPAAGDAVERPPAAPTAWRETACEDGLLPLKAPEAGTAMAYAAAYLDAPRWLKAALTVTSAQPVAVFVDGKRAAAREEPVKPGDPPAETKAGLVLTRGLHRLLVVSVWTGGTVPWKLGARLSADGEGPLPSVTLDSRHPLSQEDVLASPFVTDVALSPDGSKAALVLRRTDVQEDKRISWLQVRSTASGAVLADWACAPGTRAPAFAPDGDSLVFLAPNAKDKETSDLWLADLKGKGMRRLMEGGRGLAKLAFSPDGRTLYFLATGPRERPKTAPAWVRWRENYQRWGDWQDRPQLFAMALGDRSLSQLTAGDTNVQDFAVSRDGSTLVLLRIVFTRARPYLQTEIWSYRVADGASRRVLRLQRWPDLSEVALSPDASRVAFTSPHTDMPPGGNKPSEGLGYNLGLFAADLATGRLECLSQGFAPGLSSEAIGVLPGRRSLWWSPRDGNLYAVVTDRDRVRIARFSPDGKDRTLLDLPDASVSSPDAASSGAGIAWTGSSFGTGWAVRYRDLVTGDTRTLLKPGEEIMARVEFGAHERFAVRARDGVEIPGWLFLPPAFGPAKKYPLIVAYYGGVEPYADCFRPEFFWLAGQGYAVYLVTPRGSVGFGRDFADAHENDWGKMAGEDILEGTRALLKAKPFLDAKRVGCYGGSYGGFMTLYLVSHSDLFAAAVDFFGISNLASYWGGGWWGYNYGDTAMANSYPWNRQDLFAGQSPLYRADRIHAALLLLHGDADVNVPPVESDQIFTALRVLGRTCEYVRFAGEDHGINGKPSNRMASEAMMLEWFDKHLKGEGGAWEERWKDDPKQIVEEDAPLNGR
jgi:dipeptidyl aminopeptidase/acylaminoacyl peptidase